MALPLKYNTASQTILLGPFLDDSDGKTAKTGLSIANTDIKLAKHNGTSFSSKNSGGATHVANGYYYCTLDATDTNTLGRLVITVNMSGALPVWHEFEVLSAQMFDALYGSGYASVNVVQVDGSNLGTHGSGQFPADLRQISGSAVSTSSAQLGVNVVQVGGTTQTARDLGAQLDATISSRAPESGGNIAAIKSKTDQLTFLSGDVVATLNGETVIVGTNNDKTGYSLATAPPTASEVADAVWDEATSGHTTSGTFGNLFNTNIDTTISSRASASYYTSTRAEKLDNLDTTISSRAPASTALSNTTWTDSRASYLDNLTRLVGTIASGIHQPQSGDAYAVVTNATYGNEQIKNYVDDLESRLTAARAGYLDNLSGGAVALNADIQTLLSRVVGTIASGTHTPQSGDAYSVLTNGTYGNSALKTLIDGVKAVVDLIEDINRNKMVVQNSTGTVTLYEDNSTTIKFTVTNCLTDDSTYTVRKRLE